ncbi:hypothetical protein [uncultured Gammaproteobacteria bacterium]|jgi:hypothetical protein|nr:hypothetical protein [uncultured Gammaproteobacteria bacterium]CAC9626531.1 hypothetical protein [uncultured Gammaproteobacteria bacterium]CAC9655853.1 hypothetical protein [uncultured Gammaproteobacteria bacterium]
MTTQTEIINLEDLVPTNHLYRKFSKLIDLDKITNRDLCITQPKNHQSDKITPI